MTITAMLYALILIANAVLVLWIVSNAIIDSGKIRPFLPLIVFVVALSGMSALVYYDFMLTVWKNVFTYLFAIGYFWILVDIVINLNKDI